MIRRASSSCGSSDGGAPTGADVPGRRADAAYGPRERTYTRPMSRTRRVTGECLQQAAPGVRAASAGRTGISLRTAADGKAPTVGRGVLHGHG